MKHQCTVGVLKPDITAALGARLLTLSEVAEYLHVSPSSVKALARRRELPFIRLGRLLRFREDDVAQLEKRLRTDTLELMLEKQSDRYARSPLS